MKEKKYHITILVVVFILTAGLFTRTGSHTQVPKETLSEIGPTLFRQFIFEPFDPPMTNHLWMDAGSDRIIFLHFDKPVSEKGAKLIFVGDGIKGRFCAEDQPDGGKTGYVHFYSAVKPAGAEHGHGGHTAAEGYWLRHIALENFEMMGAKFSPGIAYNFMNTTPPRCK